MKVLVVSKPIYSYYMPLVDFPKNGDVFNIESTIQTIYGQANVAAHMLATYGIEVAYTGIIGKDEAGDKFKKILDDLHVDTRYMETNFDTNTDINYSLINTEKPGFSRIKVNTMKNDLTKYKYDFTPDFIVFDDKDFSGANAVLNNYPNVTSIFYGEKATKDAINMCKRSNYVVCNIEFASKLTGLQIELNKPKTIVNLYQKLIDLYKCSWIITLGEHGVVYCNDMQVKMIPSIEAHVADKDKASSVFFGTFAYSIISGLDIEESVRLANIGASSSLSVIGATNGILDLNTLLSYRVIKNETPNSNTSQQAVEPVQETPVQQVSEVNPVSSAPQVDSPNQGVAPMPSENPQTMPEQPVQPENPVIEATPIPQAPIEQVPIEPAQTPTQTQAPSQTSEAVPQNENQTNIQ